MPDAELETIQNVYNMILVESLAGPKSPEVARRYSAALVHLEALKATVTAEHPKRICLECRRAI